MNVADILRRLVTAEEGQGMTEYALILAFVVTLVYLAFTPLSSSLNSLFGNVVEAFNGESGAVGVEQLAPAANWDYSPAIFKT
jgi:Flp pilus assembly pilin Flp